MKPRYFGGKNVIAVVILLRVLARIESFRFEDENEYEYEIQLRVFTRVLKKKDIPESFILLYFFNQKS